MAVSIRARLNKHAGKVKDRTMVMWKLHIGYNKMKRDRVWVTDRAALVVAEVLNIINFFCSRVVKKLHTTKTHLHPSDWWTMTSWSLHLEKHWISGAIFLFTADIQLYFWFLHAMFPLNTNHGEQKKVQPFHSILYLLKSQHFCILYIFVKLFFFKLESPTIVIVDSDIWWHKYRKY